MRNAAAIRAHRLAVHPSDVEQVTGREHAQCECGSILQFDTDLNGYVVESCGKCRYTRTMRPVRPRSELDPMPAIVSEYPCIEECGRMVGWSGGGPRRKRCTTCTNERQRFLSREWQRKHKKNGRAA